MNSANYREFTEWHLRELVFRYRHFPHRWPDEFAELLQNITGRDALIISRLSRQDRSLLLTNFNANDLARYKAFPQWQKATDSARAMAEQVTLSIDSFKNWSGEDLVFDFYRLYHARELAWGDIGKERLQHYHLLWQAYQQIHETKPTGKETQLARLIHIVNAFINGIPSKNFTVNTINGNIIRN